jgi:hypothetical protein
METCQPIKRLKDKNKIRIPKHFIIILIRPSTPKTPITGQQTTDISASFEISAGIPSHSV